MKEEEKDLLLRDLCARLLYGVKVQIVSSTLNTLYCKKYDDVLSNNNLFRVFKDDTIVRPYLRPMSSMTEEETKQFYSLPFCDWNCYERIDWLNEHHFDYRGLIEKGLALEAPKDMYEL